MKSIRKFAYAAVLTLSALNFAPAWLPAQDGGGTFRLPTKYIGRTLWFPQEITGSRYRPWARRKC